MRHSLRLFRETADEIEHERAYYRKRSPTAEAAFLRELDHAIEVVLDSPKRWPPYLDDTRRYVFPTFPFSLVYFEEGDTVFVVSLASELRRPGYWKRRMRGG
jgi:plasmid stabilization system protein ParE